MNENTKGITKEILKSLAMGIIVAVGIAMPGIGIVIKEVKKDQFKNRSKRRLFATIKRLQKQSLVSWNEVNGELRLSLTEDGKKRILQYNIDEMKLKKPEMWDKLFRVIIFDIPEEKKIAREALRKKLKELEFYQLQKSVFVTPYECKEEIDFIKNVYEISPFVSYILAKEIPDIGLVRSKYW